MNKFILFVSFSLDGEDMEMHGILNQLHLRLCEASFSHFSTPHSVRHESSKHKGPAGLLDPSGSFLDPSGYSLGPSLIQLGSTLDP